MVVWALGFTYNILQLRTGYNFYQSSILYWFYDDGKKVFSKYFESAMPIKLVS